MLRARPAAQPPGFAATWRRAFGLALFLSAVACRSEAPPRYAGAPAPQRGQGSGPPGSGPLGHDQGSPAPPSGAASGAQNGAEGLAQRYGSLPALRTLEGDATYYSDRLAGRSTASGEPYDPTRMTAAHRELPFGTIVRVRRLPAGPSVIVRINDRGPFAGRGRIIDVSRRAAEHLQMLRAGVVEVAVDVLQYGGDG